MNTAPSFSPGGQRVSTSAPSYSSIIIPYLPRQFSSYATLEDAILSVCSRFLGSALFAGCNFIAKLSNWSKKPPPHHPLPATALHSLWILQSKCSAGFAFVRAYVSVSEYLYLLDRRRPRICIWASESRGGTQ